MNYQIKNNQNNMQFEALVDGHKAELVYRLRDDKIYLMHTWVPRDIGNQGVGRALTEHALSYAIKNKIELVVYCPFVKAYMKRHPDWREKLA